MAESRALAVRAASVFGALMTRTASRRFNSNSAIRISLGMAPAGGAVAGCDDATNNDEELVDQNSLPDLRIREEEKTGGSVLRNIGEQVSFGGFLGFATGYSIRTVGRAILFLVGTEVVVLQYMAYRQWLVIDWRRLGRDLSPKFDRSTLEGLLEILVYKMPFNAAFSGGLVAGLRLSAPNK